MSKLLKVSSSPHVRDKSSTSRIMLDVIVALLPASIFGIYNFGVKAALVIAICVLSAVLSEALYQYFMGYSLTIKDCSAALTGLLLALNLPSTAPWWLCVIGSVFAIIIVKQLFGGLGQNFMNPALGARCFLMISFTARMTNFTYDGITGATPLSFVKSGEYDKLNLMNMFLGRTAGTIGETSALALLIGALYLLIRKVIRLRIPGTYIVTLVLFVGLFGGQGFDTKYLLAHVLGGGLLLGAFFMATDYVSSPITTKGQYIFGFLLGIFTGIFRLYGGTAEGVSYAIIFCNLLVPLIERFTMPRSFGKGVKKHE